MADMTLEERRETLVNSLRSSKGWMTDYAKAFVDQYAIDAHLAQPAQAVDVGALIYAEHLARALWQKHYAKDAPQWEPMTGNLFGLLSQIDNMASGLTRAISNVQDVVSLQSGDWDAVREVIAELRLPPPPTAPDNAVHRYFREVADKLTAALPENAK